MTTKILTIRIPSSLYSELCCAAGELGIPVSTHARLLLQRAEDALQWRQLRTELAEAMKKNRGAPSAISVELLFIVRILLAASHPELVEKVNQKLGETLGVDRFEI